MRTDWRNCHRCGISWPYPSETSYCHCLNCYNRDERLEIERLREALRDVVRVRQAQGNAATDEEHQMFLIARRALGHADKGEGA